uniref:Uncharacterized protein n=1 Tax=Cacopsylla melanoneura TaxID=428564 RepID=A0A8D8W0B8_9HEMI
MIQSIFRMICEPGYRCCRLSGYQMKVHGAVSVGAIEINKTRMSCVMKTKMPCVMKTRMSCVMPSEQEMSLAMKLKRMSRLMTLKQEMSLVMKLKEEKRMMSLVLKLKPMPMCLVMNRMSRVIKWRQLRQMNPLLKLNWAVWRQVRQMTLLLKLKWTVWSLLLLNGDENINRGNIFPKLSTLEVIRVVMEFSRFTINSGNSIQLKIAKTRFRIKSWSRLTGPGEIVKG